MTRVNWTGSLGPAMRKRSHAEMQGNDARISGMSASTPRLPSERQDHRLVQSFFAARKRMPPSQGNLRDGKTIVQDANWTDDREFLLSKRSWTGASSRIGGPSRRESMAKKRRIDILQRSCHQIVRIQTPADEEGASDADSVSERPRKRICKSRSPRPEAAFALEAHHIESQADPVLRPGSQLGQDGPNPSATTRMELYYHCLDCLELVRLLPRLSIHSEHKKQEFGVVLRCSKDTSCQQSLDDRSGPDGSRQGSGRNSTPRDIFDCHVIRFRVPSERLCVDSPFRLDSDGFADSSSAELAKLFQTGRAQIWAQIMHSQAQEQLGQGQ